jgi:hypothetical protein
MANETPSLTSLTDVQLLARVKTLASEERQSTAALIAALAELDARRLYLGEGFPSLFAYCTQALNLSEDAAYNRMRAARVVAKWPVVLEMIADGSASVTVLRLLSDALTDSNHDELLRAAAHKSKREVECLLAAVNPQRPAPSSIRKLPTALHAQPQLEPAPSPSAEAATAAVCDRDTRERRLLMPNPSGTPARMTPLSPDHYRVQFTISRATHDKLRRVQDLLRHSNSKGDPAVIFDRALTVLLEQLEKTKLAKTGRPQKAQRPRKPGSRAVPSAVRRDVWARDAGRCAFVGAAGRCNETGFLEYHHVLPYADGGEAVASNIQLRCRTHNAFEAEQWFGPLIARERQPRYDLTRPVGRRRSGPGHRAEAGSRLKAPCCR